MKKKLLFILLIIFVIIPQTGCKNEPYERTVLLLDTSCTITILNTKDNLSTSELEKLTDESFDLIEEYQLLFTKETANVFEITGTEHYENSDADILHLNSSKGEETEVSEETYMLLNFAIALGNQTDGKFDITMGGLTALWDFTDTQYLPSEEEVNEILPFVSYENISLTERDGKYFAKLTNSEKAPVDLGGIAKGYIADIISEFLVSEGVTAGLVNLGGNTVAIGEKDTETPWNIGIETSLAGNKEIIGTVKLVDQTAVTSGIYERSFTQNSTLYHHVLDPETGFPVNSDLVSVTIIGNMKNSYIADALSTACLLLGSSKAELLMENYPEFDYIMVTDSEDIIDETNGLFQAI